MHCFTIAALIRCRMDFSTKKNYFQAPMNKFRVFEHLFVFGCYSKCRLFRRNRIAQLYIKAMTASATSHNDHKYKDTQNLWPHTQISSKKTNKSLLLRNVSQIVFLFFYLLQIPRYHAFSSDFSTGTKRMQSPTPFEYN